MPLLVEELIVLAIILIFFSIIAFWKKALDLKGIIVALIVGLLVFFLGSLHALIGLVAFFVFGELSTRIARNNRKTHGVRSIGNILGNSFAPILALIAGFNIGFFIGIAAALADTLSSEIGLLSKTKPRLITNFKEVLPGTDGGITILGLSVSLLGAIIIGFIYWFFVEQSSTILAVIIISGFLGSVFDSALGATLERKKLIGNNLVNFFATLLAIFLGFGLLSLSI